MMSLLSIRKNFPASGDLRGFTNLAGLMLRILIIILVTLAAGCKEKEKSSGEPGHATVVPVPQKEPVRTPVPEDTGKQDSPAFLEYDDIVLARVNGDPVTQYDLNLTVRSVLGDEKAAGMDRPALRKALGSLIATRAIAQTREAGMSERDLAALEKKVRAYRDELLAREYIAEYAASRVAGPGMIREYYDSHPEQFGAGTVRMYEMISADRKTDSHEQKALAALLGSLRLKEDWKKRAETLRDRGFPLSYRTGRTDKEMTDPRLCSALQSIGKGETSPVIFIKGMCHVARITHITETGPRPFEEVSDEIRELLGPVRLGKAVDEVSARVLRETETTYENEPQKPR